MDRITGLALRRAFSRVATPVIIRASTQDKLFELYEELRQYDFSVFRAVLDRVRPPIDYPLFTTKIMPTFNMLAMVLPREVIFSLGEDSRVERIYSDELKFALAYPTVPPQGVYETIHRHLRKKIAFTSTYWTKRLMGADVANSKGFDGRGVKVAVCDTGASRIHEQLSGRVKNYTVFRLQYMDSNGHGCIEPSAYVLTNICGLMPISELYERLAEKYGEVKSEIGFTVTPREEIYTVGFDISRGETVLTRVYGIHKIPVNEAVKVEASGGMEWITTPWHPFLVFDRRCRRYKYIRADELRPGTNYHLDIFDRDVCRDAKHALIKAIEPIQFNGYFYDLTTGTQNYLAGKRGMTFIHNTWCCACVGGRMMVDEWLSRASGKSVVCEGMAPSCDLISIKCLGYVIGCGSDSDIIKAVELALKEGADIISMSLGGPVNVSKQEDDPHYPVFRKVVESGVIPVVAAGNEGPDQTTIGSPGWLEDALTVGAYDPLTGEVSSYSSRGPTVDGRIKPDVVAPGGGSPDHGIDSAIVNLLDMAGDSASNRYSPIQGTSMSTPHISGLLACARQAYKQLLDKTLTVDEVKRMMANLADHEKNNDAGWGMLSWWKIETWLETEYGVKI